MTSHSPAAIRSIGFIFFGEEHSHLLRDPVTRAPRQVARPKALHRLTQTFVLTLGKHPTISSVLLLSAKVCQALLVHAGRNWGAPGLTACQGPPVPARQSDGRPQPLSSRWA